MVIRKSQTRTIKEVVAEFLQSSKLQQGLDEQELVRLWYATTGKLVERSTVSVEVKNRKLFVKLASSVVRNELNMIREGLLKELNSHFPESLIDDIILR